MGGRRSRNVLRHQRGHIFDLVVRPSNVQLVVSWTKRATFKSLIRSIEFL